MIQCERVFVYGNGFFFRWNVKFETVAENVRMRRTALYATMFREFLKWKCGKNESCFIRVTKWEYFEWKRVKKHWFECAYWLEDDCLQCCARQTVKLTSCWFNWRRRRRWKMKQKQQTISTWVEIEPKTQTMNSRKSVRRQPIENNAQHKRKWNNDS